MVLDNLKDVWKNQQESTIVFSESDIYKMIHKKSTSIVKWIFYISVIEFLLLVVLPNIFIDNKQEIEELHLTKFVNISIILSIVIAVLFVFLFYKNYKNICVNDSTKKLMNDILKTKKTVSYYIIIQIVLGGIIALITSYKTVSLINGDEVIGFGTWFIVAFVLLIFLLLFWLFYKLLYGILLNRLIDNYKELKKNELV